MATTIQIEPERKVPPSQTMTWDEFLIWTREDSYAEWVKGQVEFLPPVTATHQEISGFLSSLMRCYIRAEHLGSILGLGYMMYLEKIPSGRLPDLIFVTQEHQRKFKQYYCAGPADLVVEIISPESIARDRGDKFVEYEQAQVKEYWLIDPVRTRAEFYVLDRKGQYHLVEPDAKANYYSKVVEGFWIHVAWLWQDPLPMEEDMLKQIRRKK